MTELLAAAQMRFIEQAAIESGEVTDLDLMERAGRGVIEAIFEQWPALESPERRASPPHSPEKLTQDERQAVVLCGPGNNGGDGFVVARLLHERGWAVEVFLYGDAARLPPDARTNHDRWQALGKTAVWDDRAIEARLNAVAGGAPGKVGFCLVVDALFGTGLTRPTPDDMDRTRHGFVSLAKHRLAGERPRFVAIDIPSGLCSDSGRNLRAFPADLTITFHRAKLGHYLNEGPGFCGTVVIKDIGLEPFILPEILPPEAPALTRLTDARNGCAHLSKQTGHKYTHGHALILTGGAGKTGAARLAARGALRIGAGLVTLGVPGAAQIEVASRITALMLTRVDDHDGLEKRLQDDRLNAICLGPGLGLSDEKAALTEAALKNGRATVLDADALTLVARHPALFALLHDKCVLTPHMGEFDRLFPDITKRLREEPMSGPAFSKVDATRDAAKRAGCTVLFKGPDTVIADPSGRCAVNSAHYERAAPWLATAGSGDVLAGFITGLLARGFAPMQAARTAAYCHVECALSFGPGLIAEDLPEELPKVFRALGV